jgi:tryptophanyl-tRNA synthetase
MIMRTNITIKQSVQEAYEKLKSGAINCTEFEKQELLERYEYFLRQFDDWCELVDESNESNEY